MLSFTKIIAIAQVIVIRIDSEPALENENSISNEQLELLNIYNKLTMNDKYILLAMAKLLLGGSYW